MSNYTMAGTGLPTIDMGMYTVDNKRFPNRKFAISVHEAHGGHIVEVSVHPGQIAELYIVAEGQDIGQEIGKIITHHTLANQT